jgi:hypothetical protein
MNHTLIQMINYTTWKKSQIFLYTYINIYDVRIYFIFVSFGEVKVT